MIAVSKSQLKSHMLEYFREVEKSGNELIVTSHRKPVLKVSRLSPRQSVAEVFGDVRGKVALPERTVMAAETAEWGEQA